MTVGRLRLSGNRGRLLLAALLLGALLVPTALIAQVLEATFADLKGEVQWSVAGSTQWEAASANTVLHAGDRVRTAANSSVRLAFFEGSTTDLAAGTAVRVDELSTSAGQGTIRLLQSEGITQAQVQQAPDALTSYQVESPAALATAPATTCPWVRVG